MPYLEVKSAQGQKRLELGMNVLTVGRLPDNALVIADDKASRHHCVIEPVDGAYRVRDLGSSNGTKLNNRPVTVELLDNGDVVRIGQTELRYIDPEQQASNKSEAQDSRLQGSAQRLARKRFAASTANARHRPER